MLIHGSSLQAPAPETVPRSEVDAGTPDGAPRRKSAVAFALPPLAATLADAVANSPTANAPAVFAMFELFLLGLAAAALMLCAAASRLRPAIGSRRTLLAVAWTLLAAEGWGLSAWLLGGMHG